MSQHGSKGHITDTLDVLDGGVELVVDDDTALVVQLDADSLQVESGGVRATSNGDEDNVGFDLAMKHLLISNANE